MKKPSDVTYQLQHATQEENGVESNGAGRGFKHDAVHASRLKPYYVLEDGEEKDEDVEWPLVESHKEEELQTLPFPKLYEDTDGNPISQPFPSSTVDEEEAEEIELPSLAQAGRLGNSA